jgi:hypothetical protein
MAYVSIEGALICNEYHCFFGAMIVFMITTQTIDTCVYFVMSYFVDDLFHVQWGDTEIVTLCNSNDSAHIVANFDTLPSARKLLFIHEIISTKSFLG